MRMSLSRKSSLLETATSTTGPQSSWSAQSPAWPCPGWSSERWDWEKMYNVHLFFIDKMIIGWQANGESRRWRPGVPTSQMCFLSERLGADVSLPVPRQNHTVPGDLKFIDLKINWSVNYLLWEHKSSRHLRLDWSNTKEHHCMFIQLIRQFFLKWEQWY